MDTFTQELHNSIMEEQSDRDKYLEMANLAPTEKAKKILRDIAHEEQIHRAFLMEILSDLPPQ